MHFLTGRSLFDAVRDVAREDNPRFAVAFWGKGAVEALEIDRVSYRAICNLSMGGTNPHVIRAMDSAALKSTGQAKRIRQLDYLHAKVFLSDRRVIVGSANASANGLGFEGVETSGWLEAGVLIEDAKTIASIAHWFEKAWSSAQVILSDDLDKAASAWKQRRAGKPPLPALSNLDPDADDFPLLYPDDPQGDYEYGEGTTVNRAGNLGGLRV